MLKVLAANKCDMFEYEEITQQIGTDFAKEIEAGYFETSAKMGEGIQVI